MDKKKGCYKYRFKYSATYYRRIRKYKEVVKETKRNIIPTTFNGSEPSQMEEIKDNCETNRDSNPGIDIESDMDSEVSVSEADIDIETDNGSVTDDSEKDVSRCTSENSEDLQSIGVELKEPLREWALKNNITHSALNELLKMLAHCGIPDLPKDSRTLVKTPKIVHIETMGTGEFWYKGIKESLEKTLSFINYSTNILVNFHIDGLPINTSSKYQFWPILMAIANFPHISPEVVAIYYGDSKPPSAEIFLRRFTNELSELLQTGVTDNGFPVTLKVNAFICDTPARCFIKCIVPYNSYHGCSKCTVMGEYYKDGRHMSYPKTDCPLRTDETFRNKEDTGHHQTDKNTEEIISTPLEELPIDLIKNFPIADSLHLFDLGIMKRCLKGWVHGSHNFKTKLFSGQVETISAWLVKANSSIPSDIHRSARGLDTLSFWKGTEYRTFLLYLGPVVLKDHLHSDIYQHFLLLVCAVTICSTKYYTKNEKLLSVAKNLFTDYIELFISNYGIDSVSSNIHNLCHVEEDIRNLGPLPEISTYPFESVLGVMKRLLRSGHRPLAQVAKRLSELSKQTKHTLKKENETSLSYEVFCPDDKPANCNQAFKKISFHGINLVTNHKDQWFLTIDNQVVKMMSAYKFENETYLNGCSIKRLENFFHYPFESKHLNIYTSSYKLNQSASFNINTVKCKMICLDCSNKFVFFPLLHTLDLLSR